jgi:hypothetical protein
MPNETQITLISLLIPIVAIVMGIGIGFWAIYWEHQTKRIKYQERQLMIEKGMTPPSLYPDRKPATPEDCLRRGIIMLFLGIGLGIGYFILLYPNQLSGPPAWVCGVGGAIVGLLGVGHLVYYLIARKHTPGGREKSSETITL